MNKIRIGGDMKPIKLEFVLFEVSEEKANFIWKIFAKFLDSIGINSTGAVTIEKEPEDTLSGWFHNEDLN